MEGSPPPRWIPARRRGIQRPVLVLAAVFGLLIGLVLGALGGGGSILAVPVLVYLLDQPVPEAVLTSLLVVGSASAAGAATHMRSQTLPWGSILKFAGGGVPGALLGARLAHLSSDEVLLLGFAGVMLAAAGVMLGRGDEGPAAPGGDGEPKTSLAVATGFGVGLMTGLFGVGGGFLIVPAWTLLLGFEMRVAVGASLVVIVINAIAAVVGHLGQAEIDVAVVVSFTAAAALGAVAGERLGRRVSNPRLERMFALLVIGVAVYVFVQVIFLGGPVT